MNFNLDALTSLLASFIGSKIHCLIEILHAVVVYLN